MEKTFQCFMLPSNSILTNRDPREVFIVLGRFSHKLIICLWLAFYDIWDRTLHTPDWLEFMGSFWSTSWLLKLQPWATTLKPGKWVLREDGHAAEGTSTSVITFQDVNDALLARLLINAFASLWGFSHRSGKYRILCLAINISFRKPLLPWLSPWMMKMSLSNFHLPFCSLGRDTELKVFILLLSIFPCNIYNTYLCPKINP